MLEEVRSQAVQTAANLRVAAMPWPLPGIRLWHQQIESSINGDRAEFSLYLTGSGAIVNDRGSEASDSDLENPDYEWVFAESGEWPHTRSFWRRGRRIRPAGQWLLEVLRSLPSEIQRANRANTARLKAEDQRTEALKHELEYVSEQVDLLTCQFWALGTAWSKRKQRRELSAKIHQLSQRRLQLKISL